MTEAARLRSIPGFWLTSTFNLYNTAEPHWQHRQARGSPPDARMNTFADVNYRPARVPAVKAREEPRRFLGRFLPRLSRSCMKLLPYGSG